MFYIEHIRPCLLPDFDAPTNAPSADEPVYSRFLSLPPEIRDIVYDYYFQAPRRVNLVKYQDVAPSPALSRTCSEIEYEING